MVSERRPDTSLVSPMPPKSGSFGIGVLAGVGTDEEVVLGRTVLRREDEFEPLDALHVVGAGVRSRDHAERAESGHQRGEHQREGRGTASATPGL